MSDTSIRHIKMLAAIPARPGKITARDLHRVLDADGYEIDVRSVERDLHKLSRHFPLVSDDAHPAGWSWSEGTPSLSLPPVSPESALTYVLLDRYAAKLMPRGLLKRVKPQLDMARRELDRFGEGGFAHWARCVSVVPQSHALMAPIIAPNVINVVYEALLRRRRFQVAYRSLDAVEPRPFTVNPLGLVAVGDVFYLVASLFDYDDVRHLVLHRMSAPKLLDEPARVPNGFDLEHHIREHHEFEYPNGPDIHLELIVEPWLARHLSERRLAPDQVIKPIRGREASRITATVANTDLLFRWLRSLGPNVEIVKPASLRRRMRNEVEELAEAYGLPVTSTE